MDVNGVGRAMWLWARDLFPVCRSLTGDGVRQTLKYIRDLLPDMQIRSVPSGTQVFDWTVPLEWNIRNAYIEDENGDKIIDFKKSNLHVMGYSIPVNKEMSFSELDEHLYSLPEQPNAIPYVTSYYKERWGFCLTENQRNELKKSPDARFQVVIDSSLESGCLNYGELIIPGETEEEILLSTYICHPSMANNELSGPVVVAALAQWLQSLSERRYTYRILFLVETIGPIVYLSKHLDELKKKVKAGFVITCVGDERAYSFLPSRQGDTLADKVAMHVLKHRCPDYKQYSFLDRGSDERQYCAPGVDLPVCLICRTKYGDYSEYHTSLDDMSLITPQGLEGAFLVYQQCLQLLEANFNYKSTVYCEPRLGKHGLYPSLSTKDTIKEVALISNVWTYCDGKHDVIAIAEKLGLFALDLLQYFKKLINASLLETVKH